MDKLKKILGAYPFFLVLLPVFFVFHGFVEYYNYIPIDVIFITAAKYIVISFLIAVLFYPLFKNFISASLVAFLLMLFYLFFGAFYDFMKHLLDNSFFTSYTFIVSSFLVILVFFILVLIRKKKINVTLARYLNILLLLLLLLDIGNLILKSSRNHIPAISDLTTESKRFSSIEKPDIYLIILDEYAGATQLKNVFSFDNSPFLNNLKERGFSIQENSQSNYNSTLYSMASLLNMGYINNLDTQNIETLPDLFLCKKLIKNNNLTRILSGNGYELLNYSYFDLKEQDKTLSYSKFVPEEGALFTDHTFINRLYRDMGYRFPWLNKMVKTETSNVFKSNNLQLDSLTRAAASNPDKVPKFIYSHFILPHAPFFYDSSGKELGLTLSASSFNINYIQYLVYTNKKMLSLIDHILVSSQKPPVIVLMSDHGLRSLGDNKRLPYNFMTLNAVYFPKVDSSKLYNYISNVNQFRVILNRLFHQNLPLLKDSTSFIDQ